MKKYLILIALMAGCSGPKKPETFTMSWKPADGAVAYEVCYGSSPEHLNQCTNVVQPRVRLPKLRPKTYMSISSISKDGTKSAPASVIYPTDK